MDGRTDGQTAGRRTTGYRISSTVLRPVVLKTFTNPKDIRGFFIRERNLYKFITLLIHVRKVLLSIPFPKPLGSSNIPNTQMI